MRTNMRRTRRMTTLPEITLTPLIDTALNLLIIFMVTAPMIHNGYRIDLPKGNIKEDYGDKQEITVYVSAQKQVRVNDNEVERLDQLVPTLQKKIGKCRGKVVYVEGDASVTYGFITEEIVGRIKPIEGVSHVVLATKRAA
jgi:biopolymer transport protein TolR